MTRVVIIGGGVVGLCCSVLLAKDGHEVTVLERDPEEPPAPDAAWSSWNRRAVNQFRMLHSILPRFNQVMRVEAPEIITAMKDAGALCSNAVADIPADFTGGFRDADTRFDAVTARRPVAEAAIAAVAARTPGVTVRRGEVVGSLLCGTPLADGIPHVIGVRTATGEEIAADLIVDAGGRRSNLPDLLEAIGARPPLEERADSGFVYYGRHFRSSDGSIPPAFGPPLIPLGSISVLTLAADNGTWGLGVITSARDAAMRRLSDVETWSRVIAKCPLIAHWTDAEPLDEEVAVMAKIEDRHRTFVIDGRPVATGIVAVADAWACTNPSVGRGISIGILQATALRDVLRAAPGDGVEFARAYHDRTMETAEPWYRSTLAFDNARLAEMHAAIDGTPFEPDPVYECTLQLIAAMMKDPEILRSFLETVGVLTLPEELFARPGMIERLGELGGGWRNERSPGPNREELLACVGAGAS